MARSPGPLSISEFRVLGALPSSAAQRDICQAIAENCVDSRSCTALAPGTYAAKLRELQILKHFYAELFIGPYR